MNLLISSTVMALFVALFWINYLKHFGNVSIEVFEIFCGGFLPFPHTGLNNWIVPYLFYAVPRLYIVLTMGDFFYEDFRVCAVYVFTRKDNRLSWFLRKLYIILILILMYFIGFLVITVFLGFISGLKIVSFLSFLLISVVFVILNFFSSLLFILLANILSLYTNPRISILYSVLLWLIFFGPALVYSGNIQLLLIKVSSVLQEVLIWHDDNFLTDYNSVFGINPVQGFNMWWLLLIFVIYLSIVIFFGIKIIKTVGIFDRD